MTRTMRRIGFPRSMGALLLLVAIVAAARPAVAQDQNFGTKQLQGKVLGNNDAPLSGAIVYLQNSRNNDIKSYITEKDGAYHFAGVAADTDYTVWASFKGKKSPTKTVSSFDTRKSVYLDLHIKE
ncbi:MAG TPA: carboxypeptidase-like regulatory domain-containing protein [Acidobacteriaceae bacterium]|nr:carboxypeptidase-like regulatory domain-containing protein [Acidobacteriaceae bacterium]